MDHLERGTLDLTELRFLVLDEADEMLNMGFAEDVERILADTPADKNVALFSATMPRQIRQIAEQHAPGAIQVSVKSQTATATNISQRYIKVAHAQKLDVLTRVLEVENFDGMIVFVRTKQATEELAERLRARGYSAAAINGDMVQAQRERTIDQLRKGKLDILVATDVAARGLDVDRISHVINHDIPTDPESYVHRIGRTGRAGRSGAAFSFVTPRETGLLRAIERAARSTLEQIPVPRVEDVNASRVAKFTEAITQALGDSQMDVFRELVSSYEAENDVPATDIAAALAVLAQDGEPLLMEALPEPPERPTRASLRERTDGDKQWATYRISVGHRHKIGPRQIVGALANEGGLKRDDFGRIEIRSTFSLVELPPTLSPDTLRKLSTTRISGILIDLQPDGGRPADVRAKKKYEAKRSAPSKGGSGDKPRKPRKPRHQQR
jgi:ATP-dependent RNA helicase DeaD